MPNGGRVLKPGGVLLNFDAGWYNYLFDEEKGAGYARDRRNVAEEPRCSTLRAIPRAM